MPRWLVPAFLVSLAVISAGFGISMIGSSEAGDVLSVEDTPVEAQIPPEPEPEPVVHVPLPEEVRGLYWTAQTAATNRGDELLAYMLESGINTVVIDVKMDDGEVAFAVHDASMAPYMQEKPAIQDLEGVLKKLADAGIYRIARVAVMRDSMYASLHPAQAMRTAGGGVWRDNTGAGWLDPASPEVAQYAIAMGREAFARGFDEVQYDYVRFASDGALSAITYSVFDPSTQTKEEVMQTFFQTVGGTMQAEGIPVSFDVFGMTFETSDDFNIGQRLLDVYPYADFVSPMVYPSHYADGFQGFANPAAYPYEVITHSLESGVRILQSTFGISDTEARQKVRPWIQDFDIGAVYTSTLIEAEIQAARDAGASGWILWNARNVYEPADYLP